jgi:flagellar biosynthesis/type III secretory pathway protein FliH
MDNYKDKALLENDLYGNGYDDGYEKGYKHGSYDANKDLRRITRAIRSIVEEYETKGFDKTSKLDIVNALRSIDEFLTETA